MRKINFTKIFIASILALGLSVSTPINTFGRGQERAIQWSSTTGHDHDGATKGKKIDSGNVIFTPVGGVVATDTQAAIAEVDSEKIPLAQRGAANGVATLDSGGKVPVNQISQVVIVNVEVCGNESCQTSLDAYEGDVCSRSDEGKFYIHNGGIVGDMTDWYEMTAIGSVVSVNSQTGVVTGLEETTNKQTTITDDDSKYPSSGAVVDNVATHAGVADSHHTQTTSFGTLVDSAIDSQIPNNITIDQAANADTLDSNHYSQVGTDIAADISTHAGISGSHHVQSHGHTGADSSGTVAHSDATGRTADDHHDDTSDTYNITPATVTTTGDIKINSNSTDDQVLFGTAGDVNLYRGTTNQLKTDDQLYFVQGALTNGSITIDNNESGSPLYFGSSLDTAISRSVANTLALADGDNFTIESGGDLTFRNASTITYVLGAANAQVGFTSPAQIGGPTYLSNITPTDADSAADYASISLIALPANITLVEWSLYGSTSDAGDSVTCKIYSANLAGTSYTGLDSIAISDGGDTNTGVSISRSINTGSSNWFVLITLIADDLVSQAQFRHLQLMYITTTYQR